MATCSCGKPAQPGRRRCLPCRKLGVEERKAQNAEGQQRRRDRNRQDALRRRENAIRREAAANYPEYVKFVSSRGIEPVSASEYANRMIHVRDYPNDQA